MHIVGGTDGFRQVGHVDGHHQRGAHPGTAGHANSEHGLLRDPVEEGTHGKGRAAPASFPLVAGGTGGFFTDARYRPISKEVRQRADSQADAHGHWASDVHSFLCELEGDASHQGSTAEGENRADELRRPTLSEAKDRTNNEG